jgi:hypothetical protein
MRLMHRNPQELTPMSDRPFLNDGGATYPGARALVHPGVRTGELTVRYTVVRETTETFTLDDGYTYDKQTSTVRGPAGRTALNTRMAVTEGSLMFGAWLSLARSSHWPHPLRWRRKPR